MFFFAGEPRVSRAHNPGQVRRVDTVHPGRKQVRPERETQGVERGGPVAGRLVEGALRRDVGQDAGERGQGTCGNDVLKEK